MARFHVVLKGQEQKIIDPRNHSAKEVWKEYQHDRRYILYRWKATDALDPGLQLRCARMQRLWTNLESRRIKKEKKK